MGEIFFKLRGILDTEWVFIDGSYIRAHQHASGALCGEARAQEAELLQRFYAHGHPIDFEITRGEVRDSQVASQLIELVGEVDYLVVDKAYDS